MTETTAKPETADMASLSLEGQITAFTVGPIWRRARKILDRSPNRPVIVDASGLDYIDNAGIALIFDLKRRQRAPGAEVDIRGLAPNLAQLIPEQAFHEQDRDAHPRPPARLIERIGRRTSEKAADSQQFLSFLLDCGTALLMAIRHRGIVRWGEVLSVATEAGANAVPIVLLIGFLMGIIIAFEIGLVAQQFGAVIFVIDGVGVAMLRELGALMTAIVFAGRTGAAFAAQIGTQKVNEELDALLTFGLSPVQFLVLPRLLAALLVVPLLTVLADVVGILGGALVLTSFDIGFVHYYNYLLGAVAIDDFLVGIAKAAMFGLAIAAIGCQRGLSTGAGAISVGMSTTSAVVTSIVAIVVLDGLFTIALSA